MRIWLPYVVCGSGTDVFTRRLADSLMANGHEVVVTPFAHRWQYFPWRMRLARRPQNIDITLTNSWSGFVFAGTGKLVVVEHLCLFDPAFYAYRSFPQALFHRGMVRPFVRWSLKAADAVVTVSNYTASAVREAFPGIEPQAIHNGIDTDHFCVAPSDGSDSGNGDQNGQFELLYVGNLSRRKGADLLPGIMQQLGDDYVLRYTAGLRPGEDFVGAANLIPVGTLHGQALVDAYRRADLLIFPSRLEGFGYVAVEAMACGTPVVAASSSSLPEIVADPATGRLCPVDDTACFVASIRELASKPRQLSACGEAGRARAVNLFSIEKMTASYISLFEQLLK